MNPFLDGYRQKQADADLPGGEWYKALLPNLSAHQAGRAQALGKASKNPEKVTAAKSFLVRHPILSQAGGALAGAVGGNLLLLGGASAAEGGLDRGLKMISPPTRPMTTAETFLQPQVLASATGAMIGQLAVSLAIQRRVREASAQFGGTSAEGTETALKEEAKSSRVLRGIWGSLGAGNTDLGRVSQLAALKTEQPVESGYVAGVNKIAPTFLGGYSAHKARRMAKEDEQNGKEAR